MEKDKLKSIGIYLAMILLGLVIGWLFFSGSNDEPHDHDHEHTAEVENATEEYTCSMHPQVRQDEPGDCPICGMDLIPVSDEEDHREDDPFLFTMQERYSTWANVRTRKVEAMHAGVHIRLTGKVAVNERLERAISANFPGRIEKLYADFTGRVVQQGERLATVYSPEMMQAQQELLQAAANKEARPRLYEAARQRLRLFNLTPAQINQIEESGQASATMDVHATLSGYLTARKISEGDYVSTGQTMFSIADLGRVWIVLDAYENQVGRIEPGQAAEVEVPSLPGEDFTGEVEFVDPFMDPQTRSARIRLTLDNPANLLKPEMLVNATLTTEGRHSVVVPSTALLWTGKRSVVYVKKQQQNGFTFEFREIETGPRTEEGYIVLSGLEEGEEIAVSGVFAIDAAAQLQGQYSMMAPPVKAELPELFRSNLENLFNKYFELKNALADDDPDEALRQEGRLMEQLEETGMHALEGEHHMFWMEQYEAIEESLINFKDSEDIAEMRVHFEPLSEAFIETARTLGAVGQTFYVTFCPMYDDDRGAYWLSEFEEIKNPYFGDMMLRCGEVRETLREGVAHAEEREAREMEGHVH